MNKTKNYFDYFNRVKKNKISHDKVIIKYLTDNNIDYCIIGGKALPIHKYERNTGNINLLIVKKDYEKIKNHLIVSNYTESDNNWFTEFNSDLQHNIQLILSGSKCNELFTFPKPKEVREKIKGVHYINLKKLITFKIYCGYSMKHRMRDWQDVIELIKANKLKNDYFKDKKDEKLKLAYDLLLNKDYKKLFRLEGY